MPIYALVDTWNSAGTVFTGIGLNVTDTASAAGSLLLDLQVGGVSVFRVAKSGIARFVDRASARDLQIEVSTTGAHHRFFSSNTSAGFQFENNATVLGTFSSTTGLGIGGGGDLFLVRDAADTLAQRRSTNAQTFRVYNTFTDASNYERLGLGWSGSTLQILTERAGTGTSRDVQIGTQGTSSLYARTNNVDRWRFTENGHLFAHADNTYDIGASGANRPRDVYVANSITAGSSVNCGSGDGFVITSRAIIRSFSNGTIQISNAASNDFSRLQFGGTTSSFPALKRNAAALETKLADDSAYAPHAMQYLDVTDGVTAPGAATGRARIYVDTADGDLKVVFADGTVKTIVTDT
jgi:hypothetical protein